MAKEPKKAKAPAGDPAPKKHRTLKEPWKAGQSGNPAGRPKGSRNKLGEEFISALHADFETHGKTAIENARAESPLGYVRVIASILPKEVKVSTNQDLTDEQLDERIRQLASALDIEVRAGEPAGGAAPSPTTH